MQKMKELTTQEAFNKAAACCSGAEYCLSDIQKKLDKWGLEAAQQKEVLTRLQAENSSTKPGSAGVSYGTNSDITNGGALKSCKPSDLKTFPTRVAGRH